jgi:hypothetical protein
MAKQIKVVAGFEGNDDDFYGSLAAEQAELGEWTVEGNGAKCDMGVMAVEKLAALFEGWGDELDGDEMDELNDLAVGEQTEIERGRGCWYEIEAVA